MSSGAAGAAVPSTAAGDVAADAVGTAATGSGPGPGRTTDTSGGLRGAAAEVTGGGATPSAFPPVSGSTWAVTAVNRVRPTARGTVTAPAGRRCAVRLPFTDPVEEGDPLDADPVGLVLADVARASTDPGAASTPTRDTRP